MFIRSKMESKSQQRKKLSISSSKSNISNCNLKVPTLIQENHRSSFFKPFVTLKNQQQFEVGQKHVVRQLPSLNKQNVQKGKKSISLYRKQEERDEGKIFRPSSKNIVRENVSYNFSGVESIKQKDEQCGFRNGNYNNKNSNNNNNNNKISSNRLVISHLLSGSTTINKTDNFRLQQRDYTSSLLKSQVFENKRLSSIKKSNTIYILKQQNQLLIDNADQTCSNFINQNCFYESDTSHFNNNQRLSITSLTVQVSFVPCKRRDQVDVEVQTIQEEKEFFQYLKYKRRRQQFQDQVERLFLQIQPIKDDRASYNDRILKLHSFQAQQPQNQRQERIFNLKNELSRQQKNIQKIIVEKYSSLQKFIVELQKLQQILAGDNEKFVESFSKHCRLQREQFLKEGEVDKYMKSFEKLQITIRHFLKQNLKKIQSLIVKNRPAKQQGTQLMQVFREYKKSISEQKGLLKNCFGHIKKVPQLCYGLCGDELPRIDVSGQFRNVNNEFEMPKCIECFNSEWKLHMIIEKNAAMQSIFKVTEQLLR